MKRQIETTQKEWNRAKYYVDRLSRYDCTCETIIDTGKDKEMEQVNNMLRVGQNPN